MELAVRKIGDRSVVSFASRVDLAGDDALAVKNKLKSLIADGSLHVVLDMKNVAFLDSQGLGAMVSALKKLRDLDGSFALANVTDPAAAVLRATGLTRVFEAHPTVEAALARKPATPAPSA